LALPLQTGGCQVFEQFRQELQNLLKDWQSRARIQKGLNAAKASHAVAIAYVDFLEVDGMTAQDWILAQR
jgi:hypothetical protein